MRLSGSVDVITFMKSPLVVLTDLPQTKCCCNYRVDAILMGAGVVATCLAQFELMSGSISFTKYTVSGLHLMLTMAVSLLPPPFVFNRWLVFASQCETNAH
jgi:hypothetical protein